jgi:hypothetical protein
MFASKSENFKLRKSQNIQKASLLIIITYLPQNHCDNV